MARIFIADSQEKDSFIQELLRPKHEVVAVTTMSQAAAQLKTHTFDLIIIDLHFDESRMFDAINLVKSIPQSADKPMIGFGSQRSHLVPMLLECLNFTAQAMGAWMFLDRHEYNPDELLRVIERCLVGEQRKATHAARVDLHKQRQEIHSLRLKIQNEEWSPEVEDKLAEIREKLTALLLHHCELNLSTISHQETIDESRELKDRVCEAVMQAEDKATRTERKQTADELHHAVDELAIAEREEDAKRKRTERNKKKWTESRPRNKHQGQ